MKAPHTYVTDWEMRRRQNVPLHQLMPNTDRAISNFNSVLLCYILIPVLVFTIVMAVVQG